MLSVLQLPRRHQPIRRSRRLTGTDPEIKEPLDEEAGVTYSDYEPLKDVLAGQCLMHLATNQIKCVQHIPAVC